MRRIAEYAHRTLHAWLSSFPAHGKVLAKPLGSLDPWAWRHHARREMSWHEGSQPDPERAKSNLPAS